MKSHGTASKLDSGQLGELGAAILRQLAHIDGLGEVAHGWSTNGAALKKALQEALAPPTKEPANETQELIKATRVWLAQIDKLKMRGYDLGFQDIPLPDEQKLKLGRALLVDYQTPIHRQCQLLGIKNYLIYAERSYHKNLHPKPKGRWGWICGVEDSNNSPSNAIQELVRHNRRGLMTVEGLALYRENPDLLKDHYVDLFGSRCDKFGVLVPFLCWFGGVPSLSGLEGCRSPLRCWSTSAAVV